MPDRWGRPTPQDWMSMGSQALSMMNGFQQMQARQTDTQYKQDVSTAMGVLGANKEEGIDYTKVNKPESIDPRAWEYGKSLFLGNESILANLDTIKEGQKIKNLSDKILENPDILTDDKKFKAFTEEHGGYVSNRAAEIAGTAMANLPEQKKKIFENRMAYNASKFQNQIEPLKNQAQRLLQAGKVNEAMPMLDKLAKGLMGENTQVSFDPKTQGVQLIQRGANGTGKIKSLNQQQLNELFNQMTAEQYAREMAMMGEAAHRMNAKAEYQPFKGKDGNVYMVKPIYDALNPTVQPKYKVLSEKGGEVEFVNSPDELAQKGIYPENLDRELGKAKVFKENQQANKEYYHGQKYQAETYKAYAEAGKKQKPTKEELELSINQAASQARDLGFPVMVDQTTGSVTSQRPLTKEEAVKLKQFLNANGMNPDFDVQENKGKYLGLGRSFNEYQLVGITPVVTQFEYPPGPKPKPGGGGDPGNDPKDPDNNPKDPDKEKQSFDPEANKKARAALAEERKKEFEAIRNRPAGALGQLSEWSQGLRNKNKSFYDSLKKRGENKEEDIPADTPDYLKEAYLKKKTPQGSFLY